MKKLNAVLITLILTCVVFWSCTKDAATEPKSHDPVIISFSADSPTVRSEGSLAITCEAVDPDGDELTYLWNVTGGTVIGSGPNITWTAPLIPQTHTVTVTVSNNTASVSQDLSITVTPKVAIESEPWYLSYGILKAGETSTVQKFTLFGRDLAEDVLVVAPAGYQVSSESDTDFTDSLVFTPVDRNVDADVYVRFMPQSTGIYHATIRCISPGASEFKVFLYGKGIRPSEMVFLPSGTFQMGDRLGEGRSDESPVHDVTLSGYKIGKYLATQKEWSIIMGSWDPDPERTGQTFGVGQDFPVYYVSWYDALKYSNLRSMIEGLTPVYKINDSTDPAEWGEIDSTWDAVICDWSANGYRLPTEAEWEYAARGGIHHTDNFRYSGCHGTSDLKNFAWYSENNSYNGTKTVGAKLPNQLGLYDMSGNLVEWCWDKWSSTYYNVSPANDPRGPAEGTGRIVRGGLWVSNSENCRVSYRSNQAASNRNMTVGLRLARTH